MRALRPLQMEDAPLLLRWRNSPQVARFMYTDHQIGLEEHTRWLASALGRDDARYWIMTLDGRDVGYASVTEISLRHRTCSWAIYVGESELRGAGMGAFTTFTVMELVFAELSLRKLSCEVLVSNQRALRMYESFGFVREGRFREGILKEEGPVDVIRLGILDREWAQVREGNRARLLERGILTG